MASLFKLFIQCGQDESKEYLLEKVELYLGRDENNDIVVNDPEVSRRHARLVRQEDNYYYEDLGSTNGSYIHDQRISTLTILESGTLITIGERVTLKFTIEQIDPDATVVMQRKKESAAPFEDAPISLVPDLPEPDPSQLIYMDLQDKSQLFPPPLEPVPAGKKKSKAIIILLIIFIVLMVFCVIPWIIVDVTRSYCSILPWLFNCN